MQLVSTHVLLVSAANLENGCTQVREFFDKTLLIRYDRIDIVEEKCLSGEAEDFSSALHQGLRENTDTLNSFIGEFEKTGFHTVNDLIKVQCGYPSKLLHIITHFLDGFIGIDSRFYNLIDDSHWLPEKTRDDMAAAPGSYWLIAVQGFSHTPERVSLVQA